MSADQSTRWTNLSQQNYIPQVSIDCVIFGYENKQLKVLIPKLNFKGDFRALPGGFVFQDEDVDQAAKRTLRERTGLTDIYLEQFCVFGNADRNSKEFINRLRELNFEHVTDKSATIDVQTEYDWFTKRFISIGYYALVDIHKVILQKSVIDNSISWYNLHNIPTMIMDHNHIVKKALQALRSDLDEKLSAFNLLPETFTMKEVQELYEAIFDKTFVRTNFQKMILDMNVLERLEKKFTGAANKAPYLYRIRK